MGVVLTPVDLVGLADPEPGAVPSLLGGSGEEIDVGIEAEGSGERPMPQGSKVGWLSSQDLGSASG